MYVAATWGRGEGWFGRPVPGEQDEKTMPGTGQVLGSGELKDEKKEEKGREKEIMAGEGEFRFRAPSLEAAPREP